MADERFLAQLWATIESRKADETATKSYTRQLLETPPRIRRKIIEEAYEVNEAHQAVVAGQDTKDHLAHEAADLLYHLLVLLASADVTPAEVQQLACGAGEPGRERQQRHHRRHPDGDTQGSERRPRPAPAEVGDDQRQHATPGRAQPARARSDCLSDLVVASMAVGS